MAMCWLYFGGDPKKKQKNQHRQNMYDRVNKAQPLDHLVCHLVKMAVYGYQQARKIQFELKFMLLLLHKWQKKSIYIRQNALILWLNDVFNIKAWFVHSTKQSLLF